MWYFSEIGLMQWIFGQHCGCWWPGGLATGLQYQSTEYAPKCFQLFMGSVHLYHITGQPFSCFIFGCLIRCALGRLGVHHGLNALCIPSRLEHYNDGTLLWTHWGELNGCNFEENSLECNLVRHFICVLIKNFTEVFFLWVRLRTNHHRFR